jgi:SAM-dependent methyltransferase
MPLLFQSRWREIRVDPDREMAPDVVADLHDLSVIDTASADGIYSSQNIARLYHHEVAPALKEFHRVLKSDGMLVLTSPDLQSIGAWIAEGKLDETAYVSPAGPVAPLDMLFGFRPNIAAGGFEGVHRTGFTAGTLAKMLAACGFHSVEVERGDNFDLWAVAYANEATPERVIADKALAFPKRRDKAAQVEIPPV